MNSNTGIRPHHHADHGVPPSLLACRGCGSIPEHLETVKIESYNFITLRCTSANCRADKTRFVCCPCSKSFPRYDKAKKHARTDRHKKIVEEIRAKPAQNGASTPSNIVTCPDAFGQSKFYPLGDSQERSILSIDFEDDAQDDDIYILAPIDDAANNTCITSEVTNADVKFATGDDIQKSTSENATPDETTAVDTSITNDKVTLGALGPGHVWLAEMLKDTPKASPGQVYDSLQFSQNLQRFWQAEHNCPGGGLVYLVGRAFHRKPLVGSEQLPEFREAKWQLENFIHYVGMSKQQRAWHAQITTAVTSGANDLIKRTRIPSEKELKRIYKSDCQHCLWESLPICPIQNIDGIAYVNPVDIIRFAFAFGLEFDDIPVTRETETGNLPGNQKQYYVSESKKVRDLMKKLQEAQDENGDYRIAFTWATLWRDGFGTNRTKNNRKSSMAWTFSISPGKSAVNSVSNTFPMALGLKKNNAWPKVEHKVRMDTSILGDPLTPLEVYHGGLKKMVRVFAVIINGSYDKPERADITGTLGFGSNSHRSFGRLVQISTPPCDSKKVAVFLAAANPHKTESITNRLEWGWSDQMLDLRGGNVKNGAVLPACRFCRAKNLHALLGEFPKAKNNYVHTVDDKSEVQLPDIAHDELVENYGDCPTCANWILDATTASKLPFKAPQDYPTTCDPNCPVEPPPQRCTTDVSLLTLNSPAGKPEKYLLLTELEFPNMVKACKFAFFHLMTEKPWTKGTTISYLTANGIAPKHATELWSVASKARKDGRHINYDDPEGIGGFRFPAAWIDPTLSVKDYIETVMHELALGVAESNFELCSLWNKGKGRDLAFRKNSQDLLQELKKFGLNWLHSYPFSANDDTSSGNYGTGSWAGENWIAWMRISKILYLHVLTPLSPNHPKTAGHGDVVRLIIVFTALSSRALSHAGINESDVQEFNLYLKEFLSCVKELDIQVRHSEMTEKTKKVLETKEDQGFDPPNTKEISDGNQGGKTGNEGRNPGPIQAVPIVVGTANNNKTAATKKATARKPPRKKRKKQQRSVYCSDSQDSDYCDDDEECTKKSVNSKKKADTKKRSSTIRDTMTKTKPPSRNKTTKKKTAKNRKESDFTGGAEAFWTKSNYLSLPNLITMMQIFGLLINFWDGGGKGEKFVQEVKPLITKGVNEHDSFFVVIMEKLYKNRVLDIFRAMYSLFQSPSREGPTENSVNTTIGRDGGIIIGEEDLDIHDVDEESTPNQGQDYSPMEDQHMAKQKTFYCYRSQQILVEALKQKKPISGILVENQSDLDFYVLYKKPSKEKKSCYGWKKITFDDSNGVLKGGLWYAPMVAVDATPIANDFEDIQKLAKMSTVAIPMAYGIGSENPESGKVCVITNWWKERQSNGRYTLPRLDPDWYVREDNYDALLERFQDTTGNVI